MISHGSLTFVSASPRSAPLIVRMRTSPTSRPSRRRSVTPGSCNSHGYMPEDLADWTRVVDGVFFIDRMTPATLIE